MKFIKPNKAIALILLIITIVYSSMAFQTSHKKLEKIQKIMDHATKENLTGLVVYIKSPKYGEWIGTSGVADLENKVPMTKEGIFSLASIGKMYAATAILKLIEEGKLKLDDKIENYLPKEIIEGIPNAKDVSIRHLLGHTTGFHNYNRHPELNKLYLTGQLKLDTLTHINALRRYGYGLQPHTKPVGTYQYSSTNYLLLTMIMDNVLPKGHEVYLRSLLKQHGYKNTYYKETPSNNLVEHYGDINKDGIIDNLTAETVETTNWYSGDDGIYAPIEDATKFLEDLIKGHILNQETLKEMMTWNDEKNPDYGLGLMADKGFPYKFLMGHSGRGIGITTDLFYLPKQDMTVAIFCNTGLRSSTPATKNTYYKMRKKMMMKLFLF